MSFAGDVKKELSKADISVSASRLAECYGLLLYSRRFCELEIKLKTEAICVAERFCDHVNTLFGAIVEKKSTLRASKEDINLHSIKVLLEDDCKRIYSYFGHSEDNHTLRVNRANIEDEQCISAFLRGVFLACGSVNDPQKNYHLEFCVPFKNLSTDLCTLMGEITECQLTPRTILRNGNHIVYLKDSEQITDLLTYMGAPNSAMDIMSAKAYKQMRNVTNRRINSELANISKTARAGAKILNAIDVIEADRGLSSLPDNLRAVAEIKRDNPELSLSALGNLLNPPISRSGVNHRLNKLIELSEEIKREAGETDE
ncbi:MAG: DNA-binding protein WhiA [Clostridia bacterium]|nr:DNA-binding protein WhiA [Clostridia bacterium]